jgi:hypothetical protein
MPDPDCQLFGFQSLSFDILLSADMLADCGIVVDYPNGIFSQSYQTELQAFPVLYKPDHQASENFICFLDEVKLPCEPLPPAGPKTLCDTAQELGICTECLSHA